MTSSQFQLVDTYTSNAARSREQVTYHLFNDDRNTSESSWSTSITNRTTKVYTYNHREEHEAFIENAFSRLDDIIDLDFQRVDLRSNSDITLIRGWKSDSEWIGTPNKDEEGYTYKDPTNKGGGVCFYRSGNSNIFYSSDIVWRDVYWNDAFHFYEKNTILHEIGHALGLDHPDGSGENPEWDKSESIMSYNYTSATRRELWFSDADILALTNIWGPEDDTGSFKFRSSTWTGDVTLKSNIRANSAGGHLQAPQIDDLSRGSQGSIINGSANNDQLWCMAGWDVITGGFGNDLIRAGNGRDLITGGEGSDELWGDFGWNTFTSEKDGSADLIVIKSDNNLVNWLYGTAGNNQNGEKADIIEGLDIQDQIKIVGASSKDLSFRYASAHGAYGIGIYAGSALEAVYTGGDLNISQIQTMTSGDASYAAMNNSIDSYGWTG